MIVEQTSAALTSVLFIQTTVRPVAFGVVSYGRVVTFRGVSPSGERETRENRRSRGKDPLCLYLSIYTHTDTHMQPSITYHVHGESSYGMLEMGSAPC